MDIELIKQYSREYTKTTTKDLEIPYEFHGDISQAYVDGFLAGAFSEEAREFWCNNYKIELEHGN